MASVGGKNTDWSLEFLVFARAGEGGPDTSAIPPKAVHKSGSQARNGSSNFFCCVTA